MASRADGGYAMPSPGVPAATPAATRDNGGYRQPSPGVPAAPTPTPSRLNGDYRQPSPLGAPAAPGATSKWVGTPPPPKFVGAPPPAAPAAPTSGTESGPGILEQWFNQRAGGTDPGWEYAMGRGTAELNRQSAARGGFNSSASMRSLGDMYANATSQRESQLDSLAGGASGEHQGRLNAMYNEGLGIANGASGTASGYDTAAGNNMTQSDIAQIQLALDKAGVDQKTQQALLDTFTGGAKAAASIYTGKPVS